MMQILPISLPRTASVRSGRFGDTYSIDTEIYPGSYTKNNCGTSPMVIGNRKDPNPHWFHYQEDSHLEGLYRLDEPGGWWTVKEGGIHNQYNYVGRSWHDPAASVSSPYNKALEKLYSKIRGDVDLSIDLYQGGQTVRLIKDFSNLIRSPVRNLALGMRALVRDRKISRSSSLISNKWLEWQYGIKPTMSTIYSLTSELIEQVSHPSGFLTAEGRATNTAKGQFLYPLGSPATIDAVVTYDLSHRERIVVVYGISNAEVNALSQFTSLNPVSFIYENIPFSFVLDWIVDIGGYLRMMETALMTGLEFKSGYRTTTIKHDLPAVVQGRAVHPQYGYVYTVNGKSTSKWRYFNRSLLSSMPLPELPRLDVNLGSSRLMSAAALLRGLIKH